MKKSPSDEYTTNTNPVGANNVRPLYEKNDLKNPKQTSLFEAPDLWNFLKAEHRPIFLYGTGNGADKILDALLGIGVTPEGIFASDGFVRSRTFRGYEVVSYSSVRGKYGDDIVVLLCFGTDREEVVSFIEELDSRHTLRIPDVPLYGGEIFNSAYLEKNLEKLMLVREMLTDERSKEYFDAAVNFRLTGKYKYLKIAEEPQKSLEALFDTDSIKITADLGAYKGDTAKLFFDTFTKSEAIYAVEPDPKTFLKLCAFAEQYGTTDNAPYQRPSVSARPPISVGANSVRPLPSGQNETMLHRAANDVTLRVNDVVTPSQTEINDQRETRRGEPCSPVIIPLNFAASDHEGEITYSGSASRGAGVKGTNHRAKETTVRQSTLDHLNLEKLDFIKYDVEGDEAAALDGSKETVKRCRPSLSVSLYHKTDDLFELPLKVREMLPDPENYTFHMRRPWCIPAWDVTFYAVFKQHGTSEK